MTEPITVDVPAKAVAAPRIAVPSVPSAPRMPDKPVAAAVTPPAITPAAAEAGGSVLGRLAGIVLGGSAKKKATIGASVVLSAVAGVAGVKLMLPKGEGDPVPQPAAERKLAVEVPPATPAVDEPAAIPPTGLPVPEVVPVASDAPKAPPMPPPRVVEQPGPTPPALPDLPSAPAATPPGKPDAPPPPSMGLEGPLPPSTPPGPSGGTAAADPFRAAGSSAPKDGRTAPGAGGVVAAGGQEPPKLPVPGGGVELPKPPDSPGGAMPLPKLPDPPGTLPGTPPLPAAPSPEPKTPEPKLPVPAPEPIGSPAVPPPPAGLEPSPAIPPKKDSPAAGGGVAKTPPLPDPAELVNPGGPKPPIPGAPIEGSPVTPPPAPGVGPVGGMGMGSPVTPLPDPPLLAPSPKSDPTPKVDPVPKADPPPKADPVPGPGSKLEFSKPANTGAVAPPAKNDPLPATTYDVDIHHPKAGDTWESISKEFYNDTRYAAGLRAYNQNRAIQGGGAVDVPPIHVVKKYLQPQGGGTVVPAGRSASAPEWGAPGTPTGGGAGGGTGGSGKTFRVPQGGMSLRAVARVTLGTEQRWGDIYDLNPQITKPDAVLPAGTELKLPNDARNR